MRNNPRAARPASSHAARWEPSRITELDPQPIQQVAGKPLPATARSVAPPSFWANPHATGALRAAAVCTYAVWIAGRPDLLSALPELTVATWPALARWDFSVIATSCSTWLILPTTRSQLVAAPWPSPSGDRGHRCCWCPRSSAARPSKTGLGAPITAAPSRSTPALGPTRPAALAATAAGLDADWHAAQSGWLGAAALIDVHRARGRCCAPWGYPAHRDTPRYHWVFDSPQRLAVRTFGRGFRGLRPVSWSVLVRRSLLRPTRASHREQGAP